MKENYLLIPVTESVRFVEIESECQQKVRGIWEILDCKFYKTITARLWDYEFQMMVDYRGETNGKEVNQRATTLYNSHRLRNNGKKDRDVVLFGDVLIGIREIVRELPELFPPPEGIVRLICAYLDENYPK